VIGELGRGRRLATLAALLSFTGCAVLQAPVARTVDGVTTEGRFIEPDAYALYAMGALREARGHFREALELYERARDLDGAGAELSTRIGAVACQLRQNSLSNRAFARAARADAEYGPLWYELGRCRLLHGDLPGAERALLEAIRLDPERHEASLLAAEVAELRGDVSQAFRLRDALATRAPASPQVLRSLLKAATRAGDRARALRAEQALEKLEARVNERAVGNGAARALLALQQGDTEAAKHEASELLGADPSNGDALVIALAVADLTQDQAGFARLLESAEAPLSPASPELLSTLAALLARRVSTEAAQLVSPKP
jgi:Tfp pilus assembly protein PilF